MKYSLGDFCVIVWVLCVIHNASETSGRRTLVRSALVGSTASQSRHLTVNSTGQWCGGKARDLALDENTSENRAALVADARKLGLVAIDEDDHVHVHDSP